jgi:hypothetical protein
MNEYDILDKFVCVRVNASDLIYQTNMSSEIFCFLEIGSLSVEVHNNNSMSNIIPKKWTVVAGQYFDISIFYESDFNCITVTAAEECILWRIKLKPLPKSHAFDSNRLINSLQIPPLPTDVFNQQDIDTIDDHDSNRSIDLNSSSVKITPRTLSDSRDSQLKKLLESSLKESGLYDPQTLDNWDMILNDFESICAYKGDVIIREGDEAEYFYVLESGNCLCQIVKDGHIMTLKKKYKAGSYFGEDSFKMNCPRETTIVADSDCILWRIKPHGNYDFTCLFMDHLNADERKNSARKRVN